MARVVVGVAFDPETLRRLDELTAVEGVSRSGLLGRLVVEELGRREGVVEGAPVVVVGGVRFVPERVASA